MKETTEERAMEDVFLIELSDEDFRFVTADELREIDNSAQEFDGFTSVNVRAKIPKKALTQEVQRATKDVTICEGCLTLSYEAHKIKERNPKALACCPDSGRTPLKDYIKKLEDSEQSLKRR